MAQDTELQAHDYKGKIIHNLFFITKQVKRKFTSSVQSNLCNCLTMPLKVILLKCQPKGILFNPQLNAVFPFQCRHLRLLIKPIILQNDNELIVSPPNKYSQLQRYSNLEPPAKLNTTWPPICHKSKLIIPQKPDFVFQF